MKTSKLHRITSESPKKHRHYYFEKLRGDSEKHRGDSEKLRGNSKKHRGDSKKHRSQSLWIQNEHATLKILYG
jgi:hypothetical protein